jgi:tetratricopeptide (TPR) repeat protein
MSAAEVHHSFKQALDLYNAKRWNEAGELCEQLLRSGKSGFDALHLMGVIAARSGDRARAIALFSRAIEVNANSALAHHHLGLAQKANGNLAEALSNFQKAIAIKGGYPDAHFNAGVLHSMLGDWNAALRHFSAAIAGKADFAAAFCNRGVAFSMQGRWEPALADYDRAIGIHDQYAEAHCNRAYALIQLGRAQEAASSCERALSLRSDYAEAHSNLGVALGMLNRHEEAIVSFDAAIALRPRDANAQFNRGNVLRDLGRLEESLASFDRAIALRADHADALCNRGNVHRELKRLEPALSDFEAAIRLRPEFAEAHVSRATALLSCGDHVAGWPEYEWRLKATDRDALASRERYPVGKRLTPEMDIAGKTVLLHCEQGLGDTLQFCRYAPLVAGRGARVILEVQSPLKSVLTGLDGKPELTVYGEPLPAFDLHCPLMSLPLLFGTTRTTIPAAPRYLAAEKSRVEYWRERLRATSSPLVGLVWSGNAQHSQDKRRSIALRELLEFLPLELRYVSLQKEGRDSDQEALRCSPIEHFGEDMDFANCAAVCECLDLVISVDTSLAHLSAAVGRETWILLSFVPDWRWLLDGETSAWYPSVRLMRQAQPDSWGGVLQSVRNRLVGRFK